MLDYEGPFVRIDPETGGTYLQSCHLPWIGERTRQPDGAHVAMLAGVHNPVAVKIGPSTTPAEMLELAARLNPDNEPGRLIFISRMGSDHIRTALPPLVRVAEEVGLAVLWVCDPMHGNTVTVDGVKTRYFDAIMAEVEGFFAVCREAGVWPGGIHLEMSGTNVTECMGGIANTTDLTPRYETLCDPRLSATQALELAFLVAELLQQLVEG